jgi:hypothetical protein
LLAAFFVFAAVAVTALSALRGNLIAFFYVFTTIKETVYTTL